MVDTVDRRAVLAGAAAGVLGIAAFKLATTQLVTAQEADRLKRGEFRWQPERSPQGPVAIIVSLPDQLVHVYRNGIRIGLSSCSTGRAGHSTLTGIFTILEKDKHHHSSTYNNAPMPNMNRLTWSGIALHAGDLPGYPASHGCIRLPMKFSELLFGITHIGTPVIIANDHSQPADVTHPGAILSGIAEDEMDVAVARLAQKTLPPHDRGEGMQHAVSVLVSAGDREGYIVRDGHIVSKGAVEIKQPGEPLGSHVFLLVRGHDSKRSLTWVSVGYKPSGSRIGLLDSGTAILDRVKPDVALTRQIIELMHPGLVLVLTDLPAHPETRSARDFVVMTQDG
jgi:hypothetical protein